MKNLAKYIPQNGIKCATKEDGLIWIDLNRLEESYIAQQPKDVEFSEQSSALVPSKAYGKQIAIKPFCYKGSQEWQNNVVHRTH